MVEGVGGGSSGNYKTGEGRAESENFMKGYKHKGNSKVNGSCIGNYHKSECFVTKGLN